MDLVANCNRDVTYLIEKQEIHPELLCTTKLQKLMNRPNMRMMILHEDNNEEPVYEMEKNEEGELTNIPTKVQVLTEKYPDTADGRADCSEDLKMWTNRCSRYKDEKATMMGVLYKSVSDSILGDMKLNDKFEEMRMGADLLALHELAHYASTGQGAHSIYLDITRLAELRIKDDNHNQYYTEYNEHKS